MSTFDTSPDDDLLSAWLDGELDSTGHARVQAWLHDHPEEAARVRAWAADRDALRVRLDATLAEPLPQAWTQRLQGLVGPATGRGSAANAARWRPAAWVASLMLVSGLMGAWMQRQGSEGSAATVAMAPAAPWLQRAAVAHAVYVPEQKHPVEVNVREGDPSQWPAREQHLAQWLTKRTDVQVRLFDLRPQGFELVGGRLLPDGPTPGAQLMYQRPDGQRITLYLRRPENTTSMAFAHAQVNGLGVYYWVEDGTGCAMVGSLPREQMQVLADALYAQVDDDGPKTGSTRSN